MRKLFFNSIAVLALLMPAVCLAESDCRFALDIWGASHHFERNKGYQEVNPGIGVRAYCGNWFVAADKVAHNSARGSTLAIGGGYRFPLTTVGEYALFFDAEAVHLNYKIPGKGDVRGWGAVPSFVIKRGAWSFDTAYVRAGRRGGVLLFFVERDF